MVERLEVDVLGPLRVRAGDGTDRTPDGALQRRLLALLVLRRGHVTTADAAIDALWPGRPPRDPVAALQSHVSRLRRCLVEDVVTSTADGYRLDPTGVDVDADRLPVLLERLAVDPEAEGEALALLDRWSGPAYPELDDLDEGRAESLRLGELRVRLVEARAERRLAAGGAEELVAELRALCDREPLRERPRALLMAALTGSGRHADALRAYDDFRRLLADELGIEPSPLLAAQQAEILTGTRPAHEGAVTADPLPVPATPLLGRDALVRDVVEAATSSRIVTLVGPGGVGKTRVLLEVGRRLASTDVGPVVLCELAPTEEVVAADAVARALGIDARPGVSPADRIVSIVHDRDLVLLLDDCEHVLAPVAHLVDRIVSRCAGLRVVASSRERLRLPGEVVHRVEPLDVGHQGSTGVQLFLDRARAARPDLDLGPADLEVVADVVRHLDGLPLAIELAAARLHTHELAEVASGLDRRFALLTAGVRTSDRHGSLLAAVSWSHDLMPDRLRRAFADLSAFAGAFSAADAAAVCELSPDEAADVLAQLAERSLLTRNERGRWRLLETLRAFGADQLRAEGRAVETARRHARHQLAFIEAADAEFLDGSHPVLADIDREVDELRIALRCLLDDGDVEAGGRLVFSLLDYGIMRLRPDVLAWAFDVLAADLELRSPLAPRVVVAAAYATWMAGDVAGSVRRARQALEISGGPDVDVAAEVATMWGTAGLFEGRLDDAVAWYRRGRDLAEAAGDRAQQLMAGASALLALGYASHPDAPAEALVALERVEGTVTPYAAYTWYCAGEAVAGIDVELARERHVVALDLAARTSTSFVTGVAGASKASIEARIGDPEVAAAEYRQTIDHWRRAGMWATQWTMLRSIAALLARRGQVREAAVLVGAVTAPGAGHRIFGADEIALAQLAERLRDELGDRAYDKAAGEGAVLDADGAVELARRCL